MLLSYLLITALGSAVPIWARQIDLTLGAVDNPQAMGHYSAPQTYDRQADAENIDNNQTPSSLEVRVTPTASGETDDTDPSYEPRAPQPAFNLNELPSSEEDDNEEDGSPPGLGIWKRRPNITGQYFHRNSEYECFGYLGKVKAQVIKKGAKYLHRITGRPKADAGPDRCGQVSCSWNSSIWWCNDTPRPMMLDSFLSIARGAEFLVNHCRYQRYPNDPWFTGGQVYHPDGWSVVVRRSVC